jgi:hypothetical protein
MPPEWTFKQFKSASQVRVIRDWYVAAANEAKVEFKNRLQFLRQRKIQEWGLPRAYPAYKGLGDELGGFGEIRFKANGIEHRPIGCFTGKGEFTILIFAVEKNSKFIPKRSVLVRILKERKQLINQDKERYTHEWK